MAATPEDLLSDFMTRHKNCNVMVTMNGGSKHTGRLEKADADTLWLKSGDDSPLLLFRSAIESIQPCNRAALTADSGAAIVADLLIQND